MPSPSSPIRRHRLIAKQDWIRAELDRFCREVEPLSDLPADVADVVKTILGDPFDPDLTVKTLRNRHHISNNNFATRFRYSVGLGMREYIEELRLDAANRLLHNPDLEVYMIAMAVGYNYPETFCRAFLRRFGRTPMEQRGAKSDANL